MKAHNHHQYTLEALDKMKIWSREKESILIGSLITKVGENYVNRLYVVENGGVIETYDKKHLFAFSGEDRFYIGGDERKVIEINGWRICLNICYDLRFPVWCRNIEDYDILLFTANWPHKRIEAWKALLKARAIENQCYVLGCNCYGEDAWGNTYSGHSGVYSYDGECIIERHDVSAVLSTPLSQGGLLDFREKFPFLKDRDDFDLL